MLTGWSLWSSVREITSRQANSVCTIASGIRLTYISNRLLRAKRTYPSFVGAMEDGDEKDMVIDNVFFLLKEIHKWGGYICACGKIVASYTKHFGFPSCPLGKPVPLCVQLAYQYLARNGAFCNTILGTPDAALAAATMVYEYNTSFSCGPYVLPPTLTPINVHMFIRNIVLYFARAEPSDTGIVLPLIPGTHDRAVSSAELADVARLLLSKLAHDSSSLQQEIKSKTLFNLLNAQGAAYEQRANRLLEIVAEDGGFACPASNKLALGIVQ